MANLRFNSLSSGPGPIWMLRQGTWRSRPVSWLVDPKPSVDSEGTQQVQMHVLRKDSSLRFMPFAEMRRWAPKKEVWVSDLANVKFFSLSFPPRKVKKKKKNHTEWEVVSGEYGLQRLKIKQEERAPLGSRAQLYMVKTHVNFLKSSTLIFSSSSLSPRPQNLPSDLLYIGAITTYP